MAQPIQEMDIRSYSDGDENQILELFRLVFGHTIKEEYWKWRYMDNPYGRGIIKLMFHKDELIGHYAASPLPLWFRTGYVKAALLVTGMTHPEYRGQGVCSQLATDVYETCRERDYGLVFGFPNENIYRLYIEHLEWIGFGTMPCWEAEAGALATGRKSPELKVERVEGFDKGFDELWNRVKGGLPIAVPRVSRYLNWRYSSNPESKYYIYVVKNTSGTIQGFTVFKIYEGSDEKSGHIVDLISADDPHVRSMLLTSAAEFFSTTDVSRISCWIPESTGFSDLLLEAGFRRRVWNTYFGTRLLNISEGDASFASDFDNWYITMGDSDVF